MSVAQWKVQEASARNAEVPFAAASRDETTGVRSTKSLSVALVLVGAIFTFGFYPLTILWPSGWTWHAGQSHYLQMMIGLYATLGVFLLIASRKPLENLSLIWFTVWSSIVHGGIMTVQSLKSPEHRGHLWGDVPALFLVAAVLAVLTLRSTRAKSQ